MCIAVFREHDPATEAAVDGRAADQHRKFQIAAMQFVDDQRHLLRRGNQQGRETDGGGIDLDRFGDDRFGRHLLTQVDHIISVVG